MHDEQGQNHSRYECDIKLQIESINRNDETLKHAMINIFDISKSGIGFTSNVKLTKGYFYECCLVLSSVLNLHTLIKIVREEKLDCGYEYGCEFVGLTEYDKNQIETYGILHQE